MTRVKSILRAGRNLRDVQLLRAVPARPVRHDAAGRYRHARRASRWAMAGRPRAGRPHRRRGSSAQLQHAVGPTQELRATDDYPFPYLPSRAIPSFYRHVLLLDAGRLAAARVAGGRRSAAMDRLLRPALHGRRLPAARDEERRAVRAPVRHDLVRQLARVRRRAPERLPGRRGGPPRPAAATLAGSTRCCSPAGGGLARAPGGVAVAPAGAAIHRGGGAVAFAPIFFANLVFAQRFRESASATDGVRAPTCSAPSSAA